MPYVIGVLENAASISDAPSADQEQLCQLARNCRQFVAIRIVKISLENLWLSPEHQ